MEFQRREQFYPNDKSQKALCRSNHGLIAKDLGRNRVGFREGNKDRHGYKFKICEQDRENGPVWNKLSTHEEKHAEERVENLMEDMENLYLQGASVLKK